MPTSSAGGGRDLVSWQDVGEYQSVMSRLRCDPPELKILFATPEKVARSDALVRALDTLHRRGDFHFSVSPRRGGRRPELDDFEVLEWTGRFLARIHSVGGARPFVQRPALHAGTFAREPRDWLLEHQAVAPEVRSAWTSEAERTNDSQSREGPAESAFEVSTSTTSPLSRRLSSGTSRPLTRAPMQWCPTSVCTA